MMAHGLEDIVAKVLLKPTDKNHLIKTTETEVGSELGNNLDNEYKDILSGYLIERSPNLQHLTFTMNSQTYVKH